MREKSGSFNPLFEAKSLLLLPQKMPLVYLLGDLRLRNVHSHTQTHTHTGFPNAKKCFVVGPAMDHYRNYSIFIPETRSVINSDTAQLFHHKVKIPMIIFRENFPFDQGNKEKIKRLTKASF